MKTAPKEISEKCPLDSIDLAIASGKSPTVLLDGPAFEHMIDGKIVDAVAGPGGSPLSDDGDKKFVNTFEGKNEFSDHDTVHMFEVLSETERERLARELGVLATHRLYFMFSEKGEYVAPDEDGELFVVTLPRDSFRVE